MVKIVIQELADIKIMRDCKPMDVRWTTWSKSNYKEVLKNQRHMATIVNTITDRRYNNRHLNIAKFNIAGKQLNK